MQEAISSGDGAEAPTAVLTPTKSALCNKHGTAHLQQLLTARGRLLQDIARSDVLESPSDDSLLQCCTVHEAFLAGVSVGVGHSQTGRSWAGVLLPVVLGLCALAALTAKILPYVPPPT